MYNSLGRRGGSNRPADARARRVPADSHEGSARDFLRRHELESADAARKTGRERAQLARRLFLRATDPRTFWSAIDDLAADGGDAPCPDGLTLDELDEQERWGLARALGAAIRAGRYRPGPHREVQISKGPGRGMRTLQIANIQDRVVGRAIVRVIQPLLDPGFAPTSYGYRPRRGRENALAHAAAIAEGDGLWAWILDDVKDAFDNVPVGRLMDVVRQRLIADDIVELARVVIDGGATRGIPQGCSLSPLFLNVYLDHVLDRPWAKRRPATPLIRVADDLLVLARDGDEAQLAHQDLTARLQAAGMAFEGCLRVGRPGPPPGGLGRVARVPAPQGAGRAGGQADGPLLEEARRGPGARPHEAGRLRPSPGGHPGMGGAARPLPAASGPRRRLQEDRHRGGPARLLGDPLPTGRGGPPPPRIPPVGSPEAARRAPTRRGSDHGGSARPRLTTAWRSARRPTSSARRRLFSVQFQFFIKTGRGPDPAFAACEARSGPPPSEIRRCR
jgi:hypothetical protein